MRRVRETQRHISTVSQEFLRWGGQPVGTSQKVNDYTILFSPNEFMKFQVKYHEDFEKHKGCFTPVVTDPITERVKKNTQDFSDICYRGIQRKVVEMEQKRNDQDQETITGNWDRGGGGEGEAALNYSICLWLFRFMFRSPNYQRV